MTHPVFSKLPDRSVDPILDDLDGWKKVDGEPSMKTWIEYTSEDGKLLSGVDMELLDKSGVVVKTTRSEYDGYFLFESVPYGKYSLRIGALSANIVGVKPEVTTIAQLDGDNPTAEVGVVVARHAAKIAAASVSDK